MKTKQKGIDLQRVMEEQVLGRSVAQYDLLARINRGSISELFKVRCQNTGQIFAMRKLLPHLLSDSEARSTFARGATIEVELDHSNIARVFRVETSVPDPFIIAELIDGDNLKQMILRRGIDSIHRGISIIASIAEALNYIHARNIIHHDIKPENILITTSGEVKLTDFSLAVQKKKDYISSRRISGSPSYVAPEIILYKKYDERVDIYSLGITAYEILAGQLPYQGRTPQETLFMHIDRHAKPVPLRRLNPGVSPKMELAVQTAMDRNRRHRYPHVSLFLRDIREVIREKRQETK